MHARPKSESIIPWLDEDSLQKEARRRVVSVQLFTNDSFQPCSVPFLWFSGDGTIAGCSYKHGATTRLCHHLIVQCVQPRACSQSWRELPAAAAAVAENHS